MLALLVILILMSVVGDLPATNDHWAFQDVNGQIHEPFKEKRTKAVVVIFVTIDCPISNYYQPLLSRMTQEYLAKGVQFVLCYSAHDTAVEEVQKHAKDFKIEACVILDSEQQLAKLLKAEVTPEAFILDRNRQCVYRGRINDLYADFGKRRRIPRTHDLKDALDALLSGKKIARPKTKAIGCYIFYTKTTR